MTQQILTQEDIEDLKRFPFLWEAYQQQREEVLAEGRTQGEYRRARTDIIEALITRFDHSVSEYRKVEQALATVGDLNQSNELFRQALRVPTFSAFAQVLLPSDGSERDNPVK